MVRKHPQNAEYLHMLEKALGMLTVITLTASSGKRADQDLGPGLRRSRGHKLRFRRFCETITLILAYTGGLMGNREYNFKYGKVMDASQVGPFRPFGRPSPVHEWPQWEEMKQFALSDPPPQAVYAWKVAGDYVDRAKLRDPFLAAFRLTRPWLEENPPNLIVFRRGDSLYVTSRQTKF